MSEMTLCDWLAILSGVLSVFIIVLAAKWGEAEDRLEAATKRLSWAHDEIRDLRRRHEGRTLRTEEDD